MRRRHASAKLVAHFYLTAQRPEDTILVNVWDDSPPGAPIYIEGNLPEYADFTKEQVYNWLAGVAQGAGYDIKAEGGFGWGGPVHFKVKHPTMTTYDDAVDNEAHHEFLQGLVRLFTGLEYGGHKLYVVSES